MAATSTQSRSKPGGAARTTAADPAQPPTTSPNLTTSNSAHATKTWVLPPRAKPGRKAGSGKAKTAANDLDDDEIDKTVNRNKQKASRERKQEYIAELETKLRAYEQGDGEKAGFFQELAKKHLEENEVLKAENERLKQQLAVLMAAANRPAASSTPAAVQALAQQATRKPTSNLNSTRQKRQRRSISVASSSSTASTAYHVPASNPIDPGQAAHLQHHRKETSPHPRQGTISPATSTYYPPSPPISNDLSPLPPPISNAPAPPAITHRSDGGCGFCSDSVAGCLCDDLGLGSSAHEQNTASAPTAMSGCGLCEDDASTCICANMGIGPDSHGFSPTSTDDKPSPSSAKPSELPLPPPSTSAVPLRLVRRAGSSGKIWRLDNPSPSESTLPPMVAMPPPAPVNRNPAAAAGVALRRRLIQVGSRLPCSGDPKTCLACADDPAGQAFCSALSSTVCSLNPCASCPNRPSPLAKEIARPSTPARTTPSHEADRPLLSRRESSARDEVPEAMVPCSDAWATLRAHPNVGYAALDMLASVVARSTHCNGTNRGTDGKIIGVGREGLEDALDMLDHIRESESSDRASPSSSHKMEIDQK